MEYYTSDFHGQHNIYYYESHQQHEQKNVSIEFT